MTFYIVCLQGKVKKLDFISSSFQAKEKPSCGTVKSPRLYGEDILEGLL